MRFRSLLIAGIVLLVSGIVAGTAAAISLVLDRRARSDAAQALERSHRVFDDLQTYRESLFRSESHVVAEEPRLKAVVATEAITRETVLGVVADLRKVLKSDLFLLTDSGGQLLVDATNEAAEGHDLGGDPLVTGALAQGESNGIWIRDQRAYQMQGRRIAFGTRAVGVLIIGYRIDSRVADTVYRQTASSVVIDLDGRPIAASGFDTARQPTLEQIASALHAVPPSASGVIEVSVGNARHLARGAPLTGYRGRSRLRVVVLHSLDRALETRRQLSRFIYGMAAAALFAAVLLAIAFGRRLGRPLDELVWFTRDVAAGKLQPRGNIGGPLEIRALGNAMNSMVEELAQSRRQLAIRERLEKEMEIAARIQTAILPRAIRVQGLEMAAMMFPAAEVGGDYYDVRPVPGGCWIGVGDVSGHGVTAGLIMMMIQSALAALVAQEPDASPADMLCRLNDVLYDNIRHRLAHNDHVTLTILRYYDTGVIRYAGAHEEIIVYRAATGRCEMLPTPGIWLGGKRDIREVTVESEMRLQPRDVLVLYTDGLTEARNVSRTQFGLERACAEIERVGTAPAEQICQELMRATQAWTDTQDDDVTVVVARHHGPGAWP